MKKTIYLFFSLLVMLSFALQPFSSSATISSSSTISSGGTISYQTIQPTPTPSPSASPTPSPSPSPTPPPTTKGVIYLLLESVMSDQNGNPNAQAKRVAACHDTYGRPEWVELRNYGYIDSTNTIIDYFHAHGIKVAIEISMDLLDPSPGFDAVPINELLHGAYPTHLLHGGSVDWVMSFGSHCDMIRFDSVPYWEGSTPVAPSIHDYVVTAYNYVTGLGKYVGMNAGAGNSGIARLRQWTGSNLIWLSPEASWYVFTENCQSTISQYPGIWWGVSIDYYYDYLDYPLVTPKGAFDGVPAYSAPMSEARALGETLYAWNHGIYWFLALPNTYGLPTWFESYLSKLPK